MTVLGFDHVQISIPACCLDEAWNFYVDVLEFVRIPKPAELDQTGAWLQQRPVNLHLGEEAAFATDGRAHPALRVDNVVSILDRAFAAGCRTQSDQSPTGYLRASVFDPFGNRIELMQKTFND